MQKVFERVCKWNALRYDQEYNHELTVSLLREEYKEWCEAKTPVEKLDALCDITYVAMGGLWKMKVPLVPENMNYVFSNLEPLVDVEVADVMYLMATFLDDAEYVDQGGNPLYLYYVQALAYIQALDTGLSMDMFIEALNVVCDSNDSKSVKKTASDVKANDGDKGVYFVAPEPRLQAILGKLKEEATCQSQLELH